MSVIKNEAVAPAESGTVFTPFVLGAALSVVGSVGFISMNGLPPREASVHPINIGAGIIATLGWRQRTIPRAAAIAFGVAAVLSIWPPYPPGLIVFAIGVLIVARAHRGAAGT